MNTYDMNRVNALIIILAAMLITACSKNTDTNTALDLAKDNATEIEAFIRHYDDERSDMAEWLVAAMPGHYGATGAGLDSIENLYLNVVMEKRGLPDSAEIAHAEAWSHMPQTSQKDLETLTASYLIDNFDAAYRDWRERGWNRNLPPEMFCELLLPYRTGDERATSWREPYRVRLAEAETTLAHVDDPLEAARIVALAIGWCVYDERIAVPHRPATGLLQAPIGVCRDDCDLLLNAMRAMGIPGAIDMLPVSPDCSSSHLWNVVYDTKDKRFRMFDGYKFLPTRDSVYYDGRRKGKIYRMTFVPDMQRLRSYRRLKAIPPTLRNPFMKDVTAEYFGANKAEIDVSGNEEVFLGVYATKHGILPVDLGRRKGNRVIFRDMEPEVIFFPLSASRIGSDSHCGYPFMINADGSTHIFCPDESAAERVVLNRKMPVRFHFVDRMRSVVGCHIQTGPTPHGPWQDIHVVSHVPEHSHYRIPLQAPLCGEYLRIFKPDGPGMELAEITASADSLAREPVGLSSSEKYRNLTDGKILTWTIADAGSDDIIVRADRAKDVRYLFVIPRNDDNFVIPDQEYELMYADEKGWKSLGRKVADNFRVEFTVPRNAVFILRNLTKGVEEQVFTYRDGRQMFNLDLRGTTTH